MTVTLFVFMSNRSYDQGRIALYVYNSDMYSPWCYVVSHITGCLEIIGASLSEPHTSELVVRTIHSQIDVDGCCVFTQVHI